MSSYTKICLIFWFYFLIPSEANCGNAFSGHKPPINTSAHEHAIFDLDEAIEMVNDPDAVDKYYKSCHSSEIDREEKLCNHQPKNEKGFDAGRTLYQHFHAEFRMFATEIPLRQNVNHSSNIPGQPFYCSECGRMHDPSIKHQQGGPPPPPPQNQGGPPPPQYQGGPPPPPPPPQNQGGQQPPPQQAPNAPPSQAPKSQNDGHEFDPNCKECQEEFRQKQQQQQQQQKQQQQPQQQYPPRQGSDAAPPQPPQPPPAQPPVQQGPSPGFVCDNCNCHIKGPEFVRDNKLSSTQIPLDPITRFITGPIHDTARRSNNIIVYGVAVPQQAEVVSYVIELLNHYLKENITREEIDYVKIFYPRRRQNSYFPDKPAPICIRFHRLDRKQQLLQKRAMLETTPFTICHDLTPKEVTERKVLKKVCDAVRRLIGYESTYVADDRYLMVKGQLYSPLELNTLLATLGLPAYLLADLFVEPI